MAQSIAVDEIDAVLRDGTVVHIRPMHPTDAGRLVRFHHSLSPASTRLRFFTFHPELSPKELDRFTHVDHREREAVVALDGDDIVGVGRYDRMSGTDTAEVAFVVTDAWQGRGVGRVLFDAVAARACEAGIDQLDAVTLPDNVRMLHVLRATGLPMRSLFEDGTVRASLQLRRSTP
ncbi:MAG TPA: GNAT family N-acetyltransferase [Acidimicrobiales bacterium]|nr:GNAT family N-acetyltransferase [Acidimicrobiales bacterium]